MVWDWLMGTDPEKVDLNKEDYTLGKEGEDIKKKANEGFTAAGDREAPTAVATQIGPAAQATSAQVAPTTSVVSTNLSAASQAPQVNIGPASQAGQTLLGSITGSTAAGVNTAQQEQFRQQQLNLANALALQAQGQGPSVGAAQFKAASDRNIAQQQALAAGSRGGDIAGAGRRAAQNVSNFNAQAAQQAAVARQQEQLNAQGQLGSIIGTGRESDIGLASTQAGFQQQSNLANAAASNVANLQQGSMNQQVALTNTEAANQFALQQAQLAQGTNLANVAALNQRDLAQGQMSLTERLANASAANNAIMAQAGFDQQTILANQDAINSILLAQGQIDANTNLANLQAQLTQTSLNDSQQIALLQQLTGLSIAELQARIERDRLEVGQRDPGGGGMLGDLLAAGGTIGAAAVSDERLKTKKKKANPFLSGYGDEKEDRKELDKAGKRWITAGETLSGAQFDNKAMGAASKIAGAYLKSKGEKQKAAVEKKQREGIAADAQFRNERDRKAHEEQGELKKRMDERGSAFLESIEKKKKTTSASDINLKEDIKDGDAKLDDFLNKLTAYEYEYKDPEKHGAGKRISPMAQDLEKSELGKQMVIDTPEGKLVDYGKGLGTIVAALAHLNEKLEELKKGKK